MHTILFYNNKKKTARSKWDLPNAGKTYNVHVHVWNMEWCQIANPGQGASSGHQTKHSFFEVLYPHSRLDPVLCHGSYTYDGVVTLHFTL